MGGYANPAYSDRMTLIELSHVIRAGMVTYPGLPGPEITAQTVKVLEATDLVEVMALPEVHEYLVAEHAVAAMNQVLHRRTACVSMSSRRTSSLSRSKCSCH